MHLSRRPRIAVFDFSESPCPSGMGRLLASQFTQHLLASPHYLVLEWPARKQTLQGGVVSRQHPFPRAWAACAGTLVSADAVVMGNIHHSRSNSNLRLQAAMIDTSSGRTVVQAESASLDTVVRVFDSRRIAGSIVLCRWDIRGVILSLCDDSAILDLGDDSGLRKGDRLRLERVLERVTDPFYGQHPLGWLTATTGEAEALEVGNCASLIRTCGSPQVGDLGVLVRGQGHF